MVYIHILFSHLWHKVYLRRYGRLTCAMFFTPSSIFPIKISRTLFCIDKARKRSFTEVLLNSVLEFAWEFCWNFCRIFILQLNILRTVFLLLFQIISLVVQSSAIWLMRIAHSAIRTLCSVCKKTSAGFFRSCVNPRGFTILYKEWPTHQFYWPMDILGARLGFFPPLLLPLEPLEGSLHLG